ncbi:MAG: class I SAM-dependent methyltransferase [Candidatus Methanoperedens sp.]|nr:class I SAM-dependent methyltransferase [Candidatus Methanoperedens sp.]
MDPIEIKDDEINVEEIMRQIRENIKKRKESGAYTKEMEEAMNQLPASCAAPDDLQQHLDYINSNWELIAEYHISSHRGILGRPIVWGRQLVHGEVRRYVDLLAGKQSEFNSHVVRTLNSCIGGFDNKVSQAVAAVNRDIDAKVNKTIAAVNRDIDAKVNEAVAAVNRDIDAKVNEAVAAVNRDIDAKVNEAVAAVNRDIENKAWLANLLEKRIERDISKPLPEAQTSDVMNYFLFEEKFRGSTQEIKQRQSIFLEYFRNCQNVLDIGCGRGEFLSLLKENGIGAKGIDINDDMVLYCHKNGLDVQKAEALGYLWSLEDKSLDGVFSGQVVEHLQPGELISMVKLCYDKMKFGTYFIAETINPLCLSVFAASFYMDMSHVKPVHPETIKFLLESVGFREVQFKFFSPFPEAARLSKLEMTDDMNSKERARLEAINQNIDKLNSLLYGYQDYAVIGKKIMLI